MEWVFILFVLPIGIWILASHYHHRFHELHSRLDRLERWLQELTETVAPIEPRQPALRKPGAADTSVLDRDAIRQHLEHLPLPAAPPPPAVEAEPPPPPSELPPPVTPVPPRRPAPGGVLFEPVTREWWSKFEEVVGRRWLAWAGALILVASVSFFLKFAYEQNLFTPPMRLLFSLAVGVALILFGFAFLKAHMPILFQGLVGAGIAVFFTSLYNGYSDSQLYGQPTALWLMLLATAVGVALALAFDAMAIGVIATVGGYLAPLLLGVGVEARDALFAYLIVLDLGVLGLALFKRWPLLDYLSVGGTLALFASWMHGYYTLAQYTSLTCWLGGFFLIYLLLPFIHYIRSRLPVTLSQFVLSLLTAFLIILGAYWVLSPAHPSLLGLVALAMSLSYLVLAVVFKLRLPEDARTHNGFLVLAIIFLTYAWPLMLGLNAATLAWAVEAVALTYLGYSFRNQLVRHCAGGVLIVAALRVLFHHIPLHAASFTFILNPQYATVLAVPLAAWIVGALHSVSRPLASAQDQLVSRTAGICGGLLALGLTHVEISEWFYFNQAGEESAPFFTHCSAFILWTIGAMLFLACGLLLYSRAARVVGLMILGGLFVFALYLYDAFDAVEIRDIAGFSAFANMRFLAVLLAIIVAFGYALWLAQQKPRVAEDERGLPVVLSLATGLGLLWLLHIETAIMFDRSVLISQLDTGITKACWLALLWLVGAAAYLAIGMVWGNRTARLTGLVPLAVGLVMAWQIWDYPPFAPGVAGPPLLLVLNLRFLASLAAVLLTYAWAYCQRSVLREPGEGELALGAWLYGIADVLLLLLLSAETYTFYAQANLPNHMAQDLATAAVSVVWGLYALALLGIGFWLKNRILRLSALGLLGLTMLKLLTVDFSLLAPAYRLLSSLLLGIVMISASMIYNRISRLFSGANPSPPT